MASGRSRRPTAACCHCGGRYRCVRSRTAAGPWHERHRVGRMAQRPRTPHCFPGAARGLDWLTNRRTPLSRRPRHPVPPYRGPMPGSMGAHLDRGSPRPIPHSSRRGHPMRSKWMIGILSIATRVDSSASSDTWRLTCSSDLRALVRVDSRSVRSIVPTILPILCMLSVLLPLAESISGKPRV
jgi:hypothetical protein